MTAKYMRETRTTQAKGSGQGVGQVMEMGVKDGVEYLSIGKQDVQNGCGR